MTDLILEALESNRIVKDNISFEKIRELGGRNLGIWDELGRGRFVLGSVEQLDQYLYSYGLMIQSQWDYVLGELDSPEKKVQLVDYACGQGLASVFWHDNFQDFELARVSDISLIEPSDVALKRANGIVSCCYPNANVTCINKRLDDVEVDEIFSADSDFCVHLFSNIMDIEGFDPFSLLSKVLSRNGEHWLIVVSHDRDHNGGSLRLRKTYDTLLCDDYKSWFTIRESYITQFECRNDMPAMAFVIKLEI